MNFAKIALASSLFIGAAAFAGNTKVETPAPAAKVAVVKTDKSVKVAKADSKKSIARKACKEEGKKGKDLKSCVADKVKNG